MANKPTPALGLIHFNWAIGVKFGDENLLPTKENGKSFKYTKQ